MVNFKTGETTENLLGVGRDTWDQRKGTGDGKGCRFHRVRHIRTVSWASIREKRRVRVVIEAV